METLFDKFVGALNAKVPNLKCPICVTHETFSLLDGYFVNDIQSNLEGRTIGGRAVATVPVVCTNCGFVMQFSAGALGLLQTLEDNSTVKNAGK